METGARIDYKKLRGINPEAARKAVLEDLKKSCEDLSVSQEILVTRYYHV